MDLVVYGVIVVFVFVCVGIVIYELFLKDKTLSDSPVTKVDSSQTGVALAPSHSVASVTKTVGSFDLLNRLPFAFYLLGIIGGFILFGFTVATAAESSTAETGAMFGYTIGATLSIIGFGRIIEVLQQIRDK